MAPFDPLQLLKALSPLLSNNGGIKSPDEVPRLSSLMKKFSKKLVSRCVYCNVLKATQPEVLNAFLDLEGWTTINMWLQDAHDNNNDAFLEELLTLCKSLPMTVTRLKQNNTAKLVKTLTKTDSPKIKRAAYRVVETWMKLIKGAAPASSVPDKQSNEKSKKKKTKKEGEEKGVNKELKAAPTIEPYVDDVEYEPDPPVEEKIKHKEPRPKTVKTLQTRFRSTGLIEETPLPKAVSKKTQPPVIDKDIVVAATKKRLNSTALPTYPLEKKIKPASLITPASDSSNGPGIKLIPPKPRPVHILHESAGFMDALVSAEVQPLRKKKIRKVPSSPTTPPPTAGAQHPPKLQFYKDTLELGDNEVKSEIKSPPAEPAVTEPKVEKEEPPKTEPVKTEPKSSPEVKTEVEEGPVLRRSPRNKKKTEEEIKKEEEEKRKKLQQEEDDEATEEEIIDGDVEAMDSDATQEGDELPMDLDDKASTVTTAESQETEEAESETEPKGGLKSILLLTRRRDKKKKVSWVEDNKMSQFFYFEMDENERVNVNNVRNFGDMKNLDMKRERQNFETARRRLNDNMNEGTPWRSLRLIEAPPPLVDYGCNSKEKELQTHRQKTTLEEIYFSKDTLPESPHEPDPDLSAPGPQEPILIPVEDLTNPGMVMDYSSMDLPQPKAALPPVLTNLMMSIAAPFGSNEEEMPLVGHDISSPPLGVPPNPVPFQGVPGPMGGMPPDQYSPIMMQPHPNQMGPDMMGPNDMGMWNTGAQGPMGSGDWGGPMMEPNQMGMFGPPNDMMGPNRGPDMGFGCPPMQQQQQHQGMRPMRAGGGPFMGRGGGGGMGGNMGGGGGGMGGRHQRPPPHRGMKRGGGVGGQWRQSPWAVCKRFMTGTCRFGANCNFLHPGVNGPAM